MRKIVLPSRFERLHQVADLAAADRIDAVGRLVEEDHVRLVQQRLGDAEPLFHALGVGADLVVHPALEADQLEDLGDALAADAGRHVEQGAVEVEQAGAGVVVGEAVVLGQVADAAADGRRAGRLVEEQGLALGLADDAEKDLDERGLAGAVLAEQAEDLAALDGQRHALEGLDLAEALDEVVGGDDGHDGFPSVARTTTPENRVAKGTEGGERGVSTPRCRVRVGTGDAPAALHAAARLEPRKPLTPLAGAVQMRFN